MFYKEVFYDYTKILFLINPLPTILVSTSNSWITSRIVSKYASLCPCFFLHLWMHIATYIFPFFIIYLFTYHHRLMYAYLIQCVVIHYVYLVWALNLLTCPGGSWSLWHFPIISLVQDVWMDLALPLTLVFRNWDQEGQWAHCFGV